MIDKVLATFYNEDFCDKYMYGGTYIFGMSDSGIEVEYSRQKAIKVQTSDIATTIDDNGIEQLVTNIISLNRKQFKIISWQHHGNKNEEIILILEGDSRG